MRTYKKPWFSLKKEQKEVNEFTVSAEHSRHLWLWILPIPLHRKRAESSSLFSSILKHYNPTSNHPGSRTRGLRFRYPIKHSRHRPNFAHKQVLPKISGNTRRDFYRWSASTTITATPFDYNYSNTVRALAARAEDQAFISIYCINKNISCTTNPRLSDLTKNIPRASSINSRAFDYHLIYLILKNVQNVCIIGCANIRILLKRNSNNL